MPTKSRELWSATLVGVVVTGVLTAVLEAGNLTPPISNGLGALIGGAAAGYFLYGKAGEASKAGLLSGLLGTPFYIGMSEVLYIFGAISPPSGPTPSLAQLQVALGIIVLINLVAGSVGGLLAGAVRHPQAQVPTPEQAQVTPGTVSQNKYCIQCGALLPPGALVCPACNARQP